MEKYWKKKDYGNNLYFLRGREHYYICQHKTFFNGYNRTFTTASTQKQDEETLKYSSNEHTINRMKQRIEKMSAPIFPKAKPQKRNKKIHLTVDDDFFTKVQAHAATMGESTNAFVVRAITETMNRDNQKQE